MPVTVIQEFEQGGSALVTDHSTPTGISQTLHTLTVSHKHMPSPSCGPSPNRPVIKENEGYAHGAMT